ncbi:hypothetical protein OC846_003569 [Tilletia horrida]|uniref:Zn(2)-C6 fungal-type domain-containing protein n=1 Tax=Tilletia horrida TaxID=155126 RepID=A0AAN6GQ95_9BASI|nr:hypothetical protein OC845_003841 [Tilletia horrida]KAK0550712.1 hypothetical protein OC846_003569 [Tilletia horrida]KAK0565963.1 hypothetical protein OC861_003477 [Tilletia horrida]
MSKSRARASFSADTSLTDLGKPKKIIKRNRKITSCFQCREKKQKCDRVHPVCGECRAINGKCTYVSTIEEVEALRLKRQLQDSDTSDVSAPASDDDDDDDARRFDIDLARRKSGTVVFGGRVAEYRADAPDSDLFSAGPSTSAALLQTALLNHNKCFVSDHNVRMARAEAVSEVLSAVKINIPPIDSVREILGIYHTRLGCFCDAAQPDILWPRIEALLQWWYAGQHGLPPDPVLLPLLLVMLALGLQAKRTSDPRIPSDWGPKHILVENCSSESSLLLATGMITVTLQMSCQADWAVAYSAPLDMVRTELLRAVWHLAEHNLQFACTLVSSAVKLAQSAGLHRDPSHWQHMTPEEGYLRQCLWQNVVFFETFISNRIGQPPGLSGDRADAKIPQDYEAVRQLYNRLPAELATGLAPPPPSLTTFQFNTARFQACESLLEQNAHYFGVDPPKRQVVNHLREKYERWRESLPPLLRFRSLNEDDSPTDDQTTSDQLLFQRKMLELMYIQSQMTIHRPFLEVNPTPARSEMARQSMERCLKASERMVWLVSRLMSRRPPFVVLNIFGYHLFNSAVILAVYAPVAGAASQGLSATLDMAIQCLRALASTQRLHQVARQAATYVEIVGQLIEAQHSHSQRSRNGLGKSTRTDSGAGVVKVEAFDSDHDVLARGSGGLARPPFGSAALDPNGLPVMASYQYNVPPGSFSGLADVYGSSTHPDPHPFVGWAVHSSIASYGSGVPAQQQGQGLEGSPKSRVLGSDAVDPNLHRNSCSGVPSNDSATSSAAAMSGGGASGYPSQRTGLTELSTQWFDLLQGNSSSVPAGFSLTSSVDQQTPDHSSMSSFVPPPSDQISQALGMDSTSGGGAGAGQQREYMQSAAPPPVIAARANSMFAVGRTSSSNSMGGGSEATSPGSSNFNPQHPHDSNAHNHPAVFRSGWSASPSSNPKPRPAEQQQGSALSAVHHHQSRERGSGSDLDFSQMQLQPPLAAPNEGQFYRYPLPQA